MSIFSLLSGLAIATYALTGVFLFRRIRLDDGLNRSRAWPMALGVALALHSTALWVHSWPLRSLDFSLIAAISLVACVMGWITLGLSLRLRAGDLALLLLPFLALSALLHAVFSAHSRAPEALSWQIGSHVLIAIGAYSALALAALKAILLLIQDRLLRHPKRLNWLAALPPLDEGERLLFALISMGFGLLTLTLLSGVLFIENLLAQHLVHKTTLSVLAWVIFGVLLFGRQRYGWRGKRALRWTLVGMGVLALAFLGSKFVLELVLNRV